MSYSLKEVKEKGAPVAMAVLVRAAKNRDVLTYGDLAEQISKRLRLSVSPRHVGAIVGTAMERVIEVDSAAPPINTLVIKDRTKLPGDGADWFVQRYLPGISYSSLSKAEKHAVLGPVHQAVFHFRDWDSVAKRAFGESLPTSLLKVPHGESDGKANRLGFGGPAESPDHRRLKLFVSENPKHFGAPKNCVKGIVEWRLESADEIDVWFLNPSEQLAVEVKSRRSNDADIKRGLYQCVKYRAVLMAQLATDGANAKVRARLVSERPLNSDAQRIARKLDIETQVIQPPQNSRTS